MKCIRHTLIIFLSLCMITPAMAQTGISLEDIWQKPTFRQQGISGLRSMNDGAHYTRLNMMRNTIQKYSYQTGEEIETLLKLSDLEEIGRTWIMDYSFNEDESCILFSVDYESIYRHSYLAHYYVYDMETDSLSLVFDDKVQAAAINPKGNKVGFVFENNLYIKDIETGALQAVTQDGEDDKLINGVPDWVNEEEFSYAKAWNWSPDGKYIAFLKTNEENVKKFNLTTYGELYPEWYRYKYPKAGEENSVVKAYMYQVDKEKAEKIDLGLSDEMYIPRMKWTQEPGKLMVYSMNRLQNILQFHLVEAAGLSNEVIVTLSDENYIELNDDIHFMNGTDQFIMRHEGDGFRHLYLYDLNGKKIRQITSGEWEVSAFLGYDSDSKRVYYESTEQSPLQRDVYAIGLDGTNKTRLSTEKGTNHFKFSKDFSYYIHTYSHANMPKRISLHKSNGEELRLLEDNTGLREKMKEHKFAKKDFFTIPIESGEELNAWMIKPNDFKKRKEYPVLMYVYGGPGSQTVLDSWDHYMPWFQLLTQKGYILVSVDNRGTGARGKAFRQVTYRELGKYEIQDQIAAAKFLGEKEYIDADRIGMFGWSYGGYMSCLAMTIGHEYFRMGLAVAPVTNWRYYDSIYTERYNGMPQDNASGYDDNSPINHIDDLEGKLFVAHGMADDNVHFQNSVDFINKAISKNKQVDLMYYPNRAHGIGGDGARMHLFTKMTNYLDSHLK